MKMNIIELKFEENSCNNGNTCRIWNIKSPLIRFKDDKDLIYNYCNWRCILSPEFGYTINEIKKKGFKIDKKVECLLSSDSAVGVIKICRLGVDWVCRSF